MSLARGTLICLLVAHWAAAMTPDMQPSLPQNFKEIATKMMIMCIKKGYSAPILKDNMLNSSFSSTVEMGNYTSLYISLLSSLPANSSYSSMPDVTEPALTEMMHNHSNLLQMVEHIWNTTEKSNCFMQAFLAPFSWMAIEQNASQFNSEQLQKLLWAAKPFLEMSSSSLMLPSTLQAFQVAQLMQTFNEVYSSFSEGQKNHIWKWIKDRITANDSSCAPVRPMPAHTSTSNSVPPGCPPKTLWLKAEVLSMLGKFISRLPVEEIISVQSDELCKFFQSPGFLSSFNESRMQNAGAQTLMHRLTQECFNGQQNLSNQMDRLGFLICFYDDLRSLNATEMKKLLHHLSTCEASETDEMRKQLIKKLMSMGERPNSDMLHSLGAGVSVLSASILSSFSKDALNSIMSSLKETEWKPAQAKILAKKLLENIKEINGEELLSLGSMVRGVDSDRLKNVKAHGLLGSEGLKNISERLSSLQKKALLVGMRSDANATYLVREVPDAFISSLPLSVLEQANLSLLNELEGHSWSRAQSVFLMKKLIGNELKPEQIKKLGQAIQGVTCDMIDSIAQNDTLESTQALAKSFNLISRTQVRCMAKKLFQSLEKQRPGYFANISKSELQAIPPLLFIHLPVQAIQSLPADLCSSFLEKISQANFSSLPNSASIRQELKKKALSCLGKAASEVSAADILSLGPLMCEMDPAWISSLNPNALNATVQALASCRHIPQASREPLFTLLNKFYGAPANWSENDLQTMGPLILLNEATLGALPFTIWLKKRLSNLYLSMKSQNAVSDTVEFRDWPDISLLGKKLFQMTTTTTQQRRRRETLVPTLSMIEDLKNGNVFWSPAQLSSMTPQTFKDAVSFLGEIRNYSTEQLAALKAKAMEAWGDLSTLNESNVIEMGCTCQGLDAKQLQNLTINSLDTLELLSVCQWNQTQKEAVFRGFITRTGMKIENLSAVDMAGLGQFVCGLQPNETEQLNNTEFRDAVGDVGRASCHLSTMESLKKKAVAVLGDPKSWSEADVSLLGNIIAGLNATELGHLNSSVMSYIRQSAISLIPPDRLKALSESQLRALGPDNAAALTPTQRDALTAEQRAIVDEAIGLTAKTTETATTVPQKGGAPKQIMLGFSVLLQPLALLMLGYIH